MPKLLPLLLGGNFRLGINAGLAGTAGEGEEDEEDEEGEGWAGA
jgi:hypothetical protein